MEKPGYARHIDFLIVSLFVGCSHCYKCLHLVTLFYTERGVVDNLLCPVVAHTHISIAMIAPFSLERIHMYEREEKEYMQLIMTLRL